MHPSDTLNNIWAGYAAKAAVQQETQFASPALQSPSETLLNTAQNLRRSATWARQRAAASQEEADRLETLAAQFEDAASRV